MAGGGAVVTMAAAAGAARARRVQEVMDAFRLAGATAPDRARSLAALGVRHAAEAEELARAGVLQPGPGPDTWYLSEAAVIARRDARRAMPRWVLLLMLLLVVVGLAALVALVALVALRRS